MDAVNSKLKAVLYRAKYRSSKEADCILGGFARTHASALTQEELENLAQILQHDDPEIFAWMGAPHTAPAQINQDLLHRIQGFAETARAASDL